MPDHLLPNYMEANFRTMQFVLTRAPKVSDFPKERCVHASVFTFEWSRFLCSPCSASVARPLSGCTATTALTCFSATTT